MTTKMNWLEKLLSPSAKEQVEQKAAEAAQTLEQKAALQNLTKKEADTAEAEKAPEVENKEDAQEDELTPEDVLSVLAGLVEEVDELKKASEKKEADSVSETINANFEAVAKEATAIKEALAAAQKQIDELKAELSSLKNAVNAIGADATVAAKKEIIRRYRATEDANTALPAEKAASLKVGASSDGNDFFSDFLGLK